MGDRVAVMRKGEIQQVDAPQRLYDRPVNLFVGGFIGSPAMNMLEATLQRSNGTMKAKIGSQEITLDEACLSNRSALRGYDGRTIVIGIRPENLEDASLASDAPQNQRLRGKIVLTEALGAEVMAHVEIDAKAAVTEDVKELAQDAGGDLKLEAAEAGAQHTTVVGRFGARSRIKAGDTAEVAVEANALHFFDPETGLGIYDQDSTKGSGA
jgi:multiple sugar transport system ATP-binding protein